MIYETIELYFVSKLESQAFTNLGIVDTISFIDEFVEVTLLYNLIVFDEYGNIDDLSQSV
jgi:hypothetical protein